MKKIFLFLIQVLAIIGALTFIYYAIFGGDVFMAKLIGGVWGRMLNGLVGLGVLVNVLINRNYFK